MSAARQTLVATEENKSLPILIIDKKGAIGLALADLLKEQFLTVLVSPARNATQSVAGGGKELEFHKNIIHIPYRRKIPVIPDNSYSHIFIFYNGETETLSILPSLIKKANEKSGRIFLLAPIAAASQELDKRLSSHLYHSMPTIIYGEVFESKLTSPNLVNYFIYQARKFGRLEIPNEGLGRLYPVHLDDLLAVIIAIAFSHENKKGYHFAFPRTPFTEMSVARIFQRINPEIKIDFVRKKVRIPDHHIPSEGEYVFSKYNLEGGLRRIIKADDLPGEKEKRALAIKPSKREVSFKKYLFILISAFILPIVIVLGSALFGSALLYFSLMSASGGEFDRARGLASGSHSSFAFAKELTKGYFPADYIAPGLKNRLAGQVAAGKDASEIGSKLFLSLDAFSDIYEDGEDAEEAGVRFVASLADAKNALLLLEEMRAEGALPAVVSEEIESRDYLLALFGNTIDTLPDLLGFEGERVYLLLFQNNMEIRPGGGFIGSYGLVRVENGKFGKMEIHDVYDADGKLTTHVEPPFGLRRYLGVAHWFLRDSNFGIEGSANAAAAADLLRRSVGVKADGVIALDTELVKSILEVVGPIKMADYRETVSAENFYLLTQKHAEEDFFPGSTQKKDFLRALLTSIQSRLSEERDGLAKVLLGVAERSIKEKHLQIIPLDQKIQKIFTVNNLTADIVDGRARGENTLLDFLGAIDTNVGANKGDYYVKRTISHTASISDSGQLFGEVVIAFENTSRVDSIFGGDYKNYMRVVLPEGADIRAIVIDGRQEELIDAIANPSEFTASEFVPPVGLEIERSKVEGKEVVGFLVEVPVQTTKKVSVNYAIPQAVSIDAQSITYSQRVFKQPGTVDDPYQLILNYPANFTPVEVSGGVVDLGGKLRFDTALRTDQDIQIKFSQK